MKERNLPRKPRPPDLAGTFETPKVGNAFVNQYYHILHHSPELVHRFYHDSSKLGRPEETGVMRFTTMQLENHGSCPFQSIYWKNKFCGNKGRSSSVGGTGYRNEGARGRGNYGGGGGRGYSWGEFGNRSINRGFSNHRGGDGYQRGEHMGGGGGRVNCSGEPTFNAASAKNVAPRVLSAPA
ncbi:putative G3BP-like protein-like isoform X1 [Hibiscus syriacus]|uniref:G3BP-like protein-like isoform X1 n=1 Tax=Hibiscus syriacus TaxID=106335 RepID=A0A6A3A6M7_HIBSY|nr:putative G3BP-like protein-like isoform X1 [Hibiscus syriacus]